MMVPTRNSNLVWSSDGGRQSKSAPSSETRDRRAGAQKHQKRTSRGLPPDPGDGIVRLHRGKSDKGGKLATLIVGIPGTEQALDLVLKRCKRHIGAGGTRQGRVLIVQGDHRNKLQALLESDGYQVKLAGG